MRKLRRAFWVVTNRLLGHRPDQNTSIFILPLCNTSYDNMPNLSRFCRRLHGFATILQTFRAFSARELTRKTPTYRLASSTCHHIRVQHGAISRDARSFLGMTAKQSFRCLRGKRCVWNNRPNAAKRGQAGHHASSWPKEMQYGHCEIIIFILRRWQEPPQQPSHRPHGLG